MGGVRSQRWALCWKTVSNTNPPFLRSYFMLNLSAWSKACQVLSLLLVLDAFGCWCQVRGNWEQQLDSIDDGSSMGPSSDCTGGNTCADSFHSNTFFATQETYRALYWLVHCSSYKRLISSVKDAIGCRCKCGCCISKWWNSFDARSREWAFPDIRGGISGVRSHTRPKGTRTTSPACAPNHLVFLPWLINCFLFLLETDFAGCWSLCRRRK